MCTPERENYKSGNAYGGQEARTARLFTDGFAN